MQENRQRYPRRNEQPATQEPARPLYVKLLGDYGPFKSGQNRTPIARGHDWFLLSSSGRSIYVPKEYCRVIGGY